MAACEGVRLDGIAQAHRRKRLRGMHHQHAMMTKRSERFERRAAGLKVRNLNLNFRLAIPMAREQVRPVARNDDVARIGARFVFLVQVAGIKGSFPVSDFNGNLGRFGLDNQNRQRGFPHRKVGIVATCLSRFFVEDSWREIVLALDRG